MGLCNVIKVAIMMSMLMVLQKNACADDAVLNIVRVTPEGDDVPESSQIVIEFDHAMTVLGQQNGDAVPITIEPPTNGQWRWINEKTLVFHNSEPGGFKKATPYSVEVAAGLQSLQGLSLAKSYTHTFTTTLPRFSWSRHSGWDGPGRPQLTVDFNLAIKKESLLAHVFFVPLNNPGKRVGVAASSRVYDDNGLLQAGLTVAPSWDVQPAEDLALGREYELRLEPGIEADEGSAKGKEEQVIKAFQTFDDFRLLGFRCFTNSQARGEGPLFFTQVNPQKPEQACNPMAPIAIVFNAPIARSQLAKHIRITPDPTGKQEVNLWQVPAEEQSSLDWSEGGASVYPQALPSGLKAATVYTVSLPSPELTWWQKIIRYVLGFFQARPQLATTLQDEFGRALQDPFSLTISLDDRRPNFVLPSSTVVLEKHADSDAPFYVNNLRQVQLEYEGLTPDGVIGPQVQKYDFPYVNNVQFAIPAKIREALRGKSGVLYGTVTTDPALAYDDEEQKTQLFAQVTPYQVQVKLGHFQSLVWVTELATGEVVAGAKVTIYPGILNRLAQPANILATAVTNEHGIAYLPGVEALDPAKKLLYAWNADEERMFVWVEKGDNMALMYLKDPFEINMYRASGSSFGSWNQPKYEHMTSWGMTAQGIYRVGEKVEYKLYLRNQSNTQLVPPPQGKYDLAVMDPLGKVVHEVKSLKLDRVGSYSGAFSLSKAAAVGWYSFQVKAYMPDLVRKQPVDSQTGQGGAVEPTVTLPALRVLVSDFSPSPFKVDVDVNGEIFKPEQELSVATSAKLHAGGAYPDARAETTVALQEAFFASHHPVGSKFTFGNAAGLPETLLFKEQGIVDSKGEFKASRPIPSQSIFYGHLIIEGKVFDDRGSSVSRRKVVKYMGGDRLVGLYQKQWLFTAKNPAEIDLLIVNEQGEPVSGEAHIKVERKETTTAKVKSAGNVYQSHSNHEWVEVTQQDLQVDPASTAFSFTPPQAGTYRIIATTSDEQSRMHTSSLEAYATGDSFVVWGEESDTYLPLIPEKSEYKVGETARFLVKNPYPKATALITVERFGTLVSYVQTLTGNAPVIEIPVLPDYSPNFFVSVTALAPRADHAPLEVGQVDLGKPSFRMGYTKVTVKDLYKELVVKAEPAKQIYKPRDEVKVALRASLKHPSASGKPAEPIDMAVVVVDEAVFALNPEGRSYYDPYTGFYHEEDLDVTNFSLLNGLVGRMKFEQKGATAGGDGGIDPSMRNLFKFVSYWNPSVPLDRSGQATVTFQAPDNLTGWRVLAIAVTPSDRMGLGDASFKVNRPTEIRPVMPNQVAEGDQFKASFSVMNRTKEARQINVTITASGNVDKNVASLTHEEVLTLEPYKRASVDMPLTAGEAPQGGGEVTFSVTAGDHLDQDQTEHRLPILRLRTLESQAISGSLTNSEAVVPIAVPENIHRDSGLISLTLSPTIVTNIAGAFKYMQTYPYTCWEQKLSRAVVASTYPDLKKYIGKEVEWRSSEAFTREVIGEAGSFQADNGGMGYFIGHDAYVDPFLSAYTAVGFSWLRRQGYDIPVNVDEKLTAYLDTLLRKDFAENHYTAAMVASSRALILEAFAYQQKLTVRDLERFLPSVQAMNLHGLASFARAALSTKGGEKIAHDTVVAIMSRLNETSGTLSAAGAGANLSLRILDSPMRENCSVLETFAVYSQTSEGKNVLGERAIKLAKTIIDARKANVHWDNTQENMQCTKALVAYSEAYESATPNMQVAVAKGNEALGEYLFKGVESLSAEIAFPLQASEAGNTTTIQFRKAGEGRLYFKTLLQYSLQNPEPGPANAGLAVKREYSVLRENEWVLLRNDMLLQRGELIKGDLYVTTAGDRTFVVLHDPVPGGLEPINKELATASIADHKTLDAKPAAGSFWHSFKGWIGFNEGRWSFYHQELRHDSVRFYADYLPAGSYHLSYVAQVIGEGKFSATPAMALEMYNPEVFGRGEGSVLRVGEP